MLNFLLKIHVIGLLTLVGCGEIRGRFSADPIIVTHKLDLSLLEPYCKTKCADAVEIEQCKADCIKDFILTLSGIGVK